MGRPPRTPVTIACRPRLVGSVAEDESAFAGNAVSEQKTRAARAKRLTFDPWKREERAEFGAQSCGLQLGAASEFDVKEASPRGSGINC